MTLPPSPPDPKKLLRAHAVAVRARAHAESGPGAARLLADLVPLLKPGPGMAVAGYWPMGDEIDPRPLMVALAAAGCRLGLPVVAARGQALEFRHWASGDVLEPGPHGTMHPASAAAPLLPSLLLVPLLAFDRAGRRLGYGGGYYDRTLELLRARAQVTAMGVAFAAQEVAEVPADPHDQPLDGIATEAGVTWMEKA